MQLAPWLQPTNTLPAIQAGAQIGLQQAAQQQAEQRASDQLRLSYFEQMQRQKLAEQKQAEYAQRAAEELDYKNQDLALRSATASLLESGRNTRADEALTGKSDRLQNYLDVKQAVADQLDKTKNDLGQKRLDVMAQAETGKDNRFDAKFLAGTAADELAPGALDTLATNYAKTGSFTGLGIGNAAVGLKTKVANRADELFGALDTAGNRAGFGADKLSLSNITKQRDSVVAFENTALKNVDQFLETAKKVVDSGSPLLNKPLRAAASSIMGSTDQAAFNTARQAVIPEFAKLLGNPTLSGQLTDSQRKEVDTILNPDATMGQIIASINILKRDAENRKTSLDQARDAINERLSKTPGQKSRTTAINQPKNGDREPLPDGGKKEYYNGSWYRVKE